MRAKVLSASETADVIWLCRRLASALHSGTPILSALDTLARQAPCALREPLRAVQQRVGSGGRVSDVLMEHGWPSFACGIVRNGDVTNTLDRALTVVAETLEAERALQHPGNRRLRAYALAFGRLGAMIRVGVPILTALESAAESVPRTQAADVLMKARQCVSQGADLGDALTRLHPALPEMTIEMIRDAERDGRLGQALAVVSDYLRDEA